MHLKANTHRRMRLERIIIPLKNRSLKTVIMAAPPLFEIIYLEQLQGCYPVHESIKAVWKDRIEHVEPEKRILICLRTCFRLQISGNIAHAVVVRPQNPYLAERRRVRTDTNEASRYDVAAVTLLMIIFDKYSHFASERNSSSRRCADRTDQKSC